ncbi:MAG: hypothetical protein WC517_02925 [Patescibacteria group bacterium]
MTINNIASPSITDAELKTLFDQAANVGKTKADLEDAINQYDSSPSPANEMAAEQAATAEQKATGDAIPEGSGVVGKLQEILGSMLAWFLYYIAIGLGWIMMLICKVMLIIGVFNSFLKQPAVQAGWTITRDICNNFFIIFMMILAVGVTLHLPSYAWRTLLPKILIYAVLINFSLLFTGILIDVSQILMLTFASPLATTQGYNIIISAFGLPDAYSMTKVIDQWTQNSDTGILNPGSIDFFDIIAALLFAIIVTIVAIVVVTCITVILVYRIIMLMFLAILSPLYFLAKAAPNISQLSQISSEWVGKLGKMLTVGPAMMFFLYLSFMTMAAVNNLNPGDGAQKMPILQDMKVSDEAANLNTSNQTSVLKPGSTTSGANPGEALSTEQDYSALSNMASVNGVINFLVVVGLLWVSLMMGQKFGDGASKVAGQGMGWLSGAAKKYSGFNLGKKGVNELKKVPGAVVSGAVGKVGTGALGTASAATRGLGRAVGSEGLQKLGEVGGQWRQDVLGARRKARIAKLSKVMGKMGLGSDEVKKKWGEFTDTDLAKRTKAAALGLGSVGATVGTAILTGGAGLAPGLAIAAAGYLSGGGRLAELGLGQWGIRRAKGREEKQKKIDEAKKATAQIVADSEAGRDAEVVTNTEAYKKAADDKLSDEKKDLAEERDEKLNRAQEHFDSSIPKQLRDEYYGIKNTTLNNDPYSLQGYNPEIIKSLQSGGWKNGQKVTNKALNNAKELLLKNTKYDSVHAGETALKLLTDQANQEYQQGIQAPESAHAASYSKLDAVKKQFENEAENSHHDNVVNKLKNQYSKATNPEEKKILDVERKRFETEYDAKVTSNLHTERIQADLDAKLDLINKSADPESKKIEDRRRAQKEYDEEKSRINKSYTNTTDSAQHQELKPRAVDKLLEDYKPYAHENWVSQGVAKDAQKIMQTVKDLISSMEENGNDLLDGFYQTSRGSFYSNNGQTETQFKSIKAMTDSTKVIQNLIDALSKVEMKNPTGESAQLVKELKQGIAAYHKAGGDTSKLTAVITLLDQKKGTGKNGKVIDDKTVSEYEADVKPKK